MDRGGTVLRQGGVMACGGVAFVFVPSVFGMLFVHLVHIVVTVGLRQYRSGGDRQVFAVTFDYGVIGDKPFVVEPVAVYEK